MNFEIASKETVIIANWHDAKMYCFSLGDGWRLPTIKELNQIHRSRNDFENFYHWSSTTECDSHAWSHGFSNRGNSHLTIKTASIYVRAIRDLT